MCTAAAPVLLPPPSTCCYRLLMQDQVALVVPVRSVSWPPTQQEYPPMPQLMSDMGVACPPICSTTDLMKHRLALQWSQWAVLIR